MSSDEQEGHMHTVYVHPVSPAILTFAFRLFSAKDIYRRCTQLCRQIIKKQQMVQEGHTYSQPWGVSSHQN